MRIGPSRSISGSTSTSGTDGLVNAASRPIPDSLRRPIVVILSALGLTFLALGAPHWRASAVQPAPRVAVSSDEHDLGEIAVDGAATVTARIHNRGSAPLEIAAISTSCGCTSAEVEETTVPPGASTELSITVDHALMPTEGEFHHVVFLATNDPDQSEVWVEVRGVGAPGSRGVVGREAVPALLGPADARVEVYFNDACADCLEYIEESLLPTLSAHGLEDVALFDYLKERSNRTELHRRNVELGIPFELQSHLVTFVDERLVLGGHVPVDMIGEALAARAPDAGLLLYQDKMPEMGQRVLDYRIWDLRGEVLTFPIAVPLTTSLLELELVAERAASPDGSWGARRLVPLVLGAGLLDGVNPCAIAVLLFSLALLFTLRRSRRQVLLIGGVYVAMIFVAYLGIGLGLFGAIVISGEQHLLARTGSWLLVGLGLVNVKDYFWYGRGPSLSVYKVGHELIKGWLQRATVPAAAVAGLLVGLCTFPCTGGIYVAILGLLSTQTSYWEGLSYLVLYNVMFVAPLVALLFALGNRRSVGALARWQAQHKRGVKLATGAIMVGLGATILVWFV